jgi:hypothetical protein
MAQFIRPLIANDAAGRDANSILNFLRLPARLTVEQTARLCGFQNHDIPVLIKKKLLNPLGSNQRNSVRYFARSEIEEKCEDRKWLDRATKAISRSKGAAPEVSSTSLEADSRPKNVVGK